MDRHDEALYKIFFEKTHYGLVFKVEHSAFRIIAVGDQFLKLTGLERASLMHKSLTDMPGSFLHASTMQVFKGVLEHPEETVISPFLQPTANPDKQLYVSVIVTPLLNENGDVAYLFYKICDLDASVIATEELIDQAPWQAENRLKMERAEEMLRIAIESANLGTWNYDPKSKILTVSARLKELFGYNQEEEIDYNKFMDRLTEDYRYTLLKTIRTAMAEGDQFNLEFSIIDRRDGNVRWMSATGKIYRDEDGVPLRLSGILIEITEHKLDEIRKNDFIAMVSHELKTPLTSLKAYVQLLSLKAKQNNDPLTIKSLSKVDGQVNKMNKMIRSFLDLSRLESGKIFLEKDVFTIDKLIREIVEEVSLTDKTHTILFSACKPLEVHADREKIGQVINNLLSNAIKYSPLHSKITIRCDMIGKDVRVAVSDEGIGLAKEDIDKLFNRFYRVKNMQLKTVSGFGIGLYLSAEIISRHNGAIWVESEEDKGSVFYFSLPVV